jgi:hypothetical protein
MLPDYVVDELLKRERAKDPTREQIQLDLPQKPRQAPVPAAPGGSKGESVIVIDMCPDESETSEALTEASESESHSD